MIKKIHFICSLCITVLFGMLSMTLSTPSALAVSASLINQQEKVLTKQAPTVSPQYLRKALEMYYCAQEKGIKTTQYLVLIDFTKASSIKRLWLFDTLKGTLLLNTWVTHGQHSGELYARYFSNKLESHASSLGLYLTGDIYVGSHGKSLTLKGMTPGYNDNALKRHIVMHGAWYVSPDLIKKYGRIGTSWGCPAVSEEVVVPLIEQIKGGSIIVAFFHDKQWINDSPFLNCKVIK